MLRKKYIPKAIHCLDLTIVELVFNSNYKLTGSTWCGVSNLNKSQENAGTCNFILDAVVATKATKPWDAIDAQL